jgi:hypothetical protein
VSWLWSDRATLVATPVPAKSAENVSTLRTIPLVAKKAAPPESTPSANPAGIPLTWLQSTGFPLALTVPRAEFRSDRRGYRESWSWSPAATWVAEDPTFDSATRSS